MRALLLDAERHLALIDTPIPALARPNDVLVRVRAVGVCGSDIHGYLGHTGRRVPPLVMGHEATGEVVAVGAERNGCAPEIASPRTRSRPVGTAGRASPGSARSASTAASSA